MTILQSTRVIPTSVSFRSQGLSPRSVTWNIHSMKLPKKQHFTKENIENFGKIAFCVGKTKSAVVSKKSLTSLA